MRRTWMVALLAVAAAFCAPRARADTTSQIYTDLRDTVAEVIESEIAKSAVKTLRAGAPRLSAYLDDTLTKLETGHWGAVRSALRSDLTTFGSDYIYYALTSCKLTDAASEPKCLDAFLKATSQLPMLHASCVAATPSDDNTKLACSIAQATEAMFLRQPEDARGHLVDAFLTLALSNTSDGVDAERRRATLRTAFVEWLSDPDAFDKQFRDALSFIEAEKIPLADPKTILDDCDKSPQGLAPLHLCMMVAASTNAKTKLSITISGVTQAKLETEVELGKLDAAQLAAELAKGATNKVVVEQLLEQVPTFVEERKKLKESIATSQKQQAPAKLKRSVEVRLGSFSIVGGLDEQLDPVEVSGGNNVLWATADALRSVERERTIRELLTKFWTIDGNPNTKDAVVTALQRFLRVRNLIARLKTKWYAWSWNQSAGSHWEPATALRLALPTINEPLKSVIDALDATARANHPKLSSIVAAAERADYGQVVSNLLAKALPTSDDDKNLDTTYRRLIVSFASYVADAESGSDTTVSSQAFRTSARDALVHANKKGVPASGSGHGYWAPHIGIAQAWNGDYHNAAEHQGTRYVVVATWPSFYYAFSEYLGASVSALDLLAPFSELALRKSENVRYRNQGWMAVDLLRPRISIWGAIPQLTRYVVLSGSVGLRPVSVASEGTDEKGVPVYRYGFLGGEDAVNRLDLLVGANLVF